MLLTWLGQAPLKFKLDISRPCKTLIRLINKNNTV